MTPLEIDRAMYEMVAKMAQECKNKLALIPKENTAEQKALKVEHGMYCLCNNAGTGYHNIPNDNQRKAFLNMRKRIIEKIISKNSKINEAFDKLNQEEQMCFVASLQAEIFIRDQMYKNYLDEFDKAVAYGDVDSAFELKIKIGTLQNVFSEWEAWRIENDLYPHMFEEI